MALFQRFWRRLTVISHAERLISDESSSVGDTVMIGAGRIEPRELNYYTFENRQLFTHPRVDPPTEPPPFSHYFRIQANQREGRFCPVGRSRSPPGTPLFFLGR